MALVAHPTKRPIAAYRFRVVPAGGELAHAAGMNLTSVSFDDSLAKPSVVRLATAFRSSPSPRLADVVRETFPDRAFDVLMFDADGKACARLAITFDTVRAKYGNLRADNASVWEDVAEMIGATMQPLEWLETAAPDAR